MIFGGKTAAKSRPNSSNFVSTSNENLFRMHADMTSLEESDILTFLKVLKRSKSVPEGPPWSPKGLQKRSKGIPKAFQRLFKALAKAFQWIF